MGNLVPGILKQTQKLRVVPTRVFRRLGKEGPQFVVCVRSSWIIKAGAETWSADEEIVQGCGSQGRCDHTGLIPVGEAEISDRWVAVNRRGSCRSFHRSCHREFVPEALGYAETLLPRPAKADRVLRVDGQRHILSDSSGADEVVNTVFVFGD